MKCEGNKATIIQHCATFGNLKTEVRKFEVSDPEPHAQYPVSVSVSFVEPRKRSWGSYRVYGGFRYITIEHDGKVLYDSRADVPIDMAKWQALYDENKAKWLERQAEIDKENAEQASKGHRWHTQQMGDFRD